MPKQYHLAVLCVSVLAGCGNPSVTLQGVGPTSSGGVSLADLETQLTEQLSERFKDLNGKVVIDGFKKPNADLNQYVIDIGISFKEHTTYTGVVVYPVAPGYLAGTLDLKHNDPPRSAPILLRF